jgi:hypothetical protein
MLQSLLQMIMMLLQALMGQMQGGGQGGNAGGAGAAGGAGSAGGAGALGGLAERKPSPGDSGGSGGSEGPGGSSGGGDGGGGGVDDRHDTNGKTAQQLNTTGAAGAVSDAEIAKAAGGDKDIEGVLKKMDGDVEGHNALRKALDKGTTYQKGQLDGNVVGLTETSSNGPPKVTLESLSVDTAAHETAHAAYDGMSHAEVYKFGERVQSRVGK